MRQRCLLRPGSRDDGGAEVPRFNKVDPEILLPSGTRNKDATRGSWPYY